MNKKSNKLKFFINKKFNLYLINADYSSLYNNYDTFYSVFSSLHPLLFDKVDSDYIKKVFKTYFINKTKTILESMTYYSLIKNFRNYNIHEKSDVLFNLIINKIKNNEYNDRLFMLSNKQFFILYTIIFSVFYYYLKNDQTFIDFIENLEIFELYYSEEEKKIVENTKKAKNIIIQLADFMKNENLNPVFCSSNLYPYFTEYYAPQQSNIYEISIKESFKHYIYVLYGCAKGFEKTNKNYDSSIVFYFFDKVKKDTLGFKNFMQNLSTVALNLKNKKIIKGYFLEDSFSIRGLYFLFYDSKEDNLLFNIFFSNFNNESNAYIKNNIKVIFPIKKEKIGFLSNIFS